MHTRITQSVVGLAALLFALPAHAAIPQLDPTWFASQLFWLAISFVVMMVLVRTAIAPSIESVLTNRKDAIAAAIREAELARNQATQANADMTAAISDARSKAATLTNDAKTQAAVRAGESMQALDQELKAKLTKAEAHINQAKTSALEDLQTHAASLAQSIVEKIIGTSVTAEDALTITRKVS